MTRKLADKITEKVYIAGEILVPNGGSVAATVPGQANVGVLAAEGQAVYFAFNSGFAGPTSPGYVAAGTYIELRVARESITSLYVYSPAGGTAHILYFSEG